ncbi:hypothetical protein [Vibrio breoganii]|uniref:hypothetical protein n=1 Tax=Vibrio breoganii TaxID=553239 RepID=UPI0010550350|nr:hypothetical protein [Vibrio breoganii]
MVLNLLFLILLLGLLIFITGKDLYRNSIYEGPFWFSIVLLGWFIPKYFSMMGKDNSSIFLAYVFLCTSFFIFAFRINVNFNFKQRYLDGKYLNIWLIFTSVIGLIAYVKARSVLDVYQELHGGHLTGFITILFFLSKLLVINFAVSFNNFLNKRNITAIIYMLPSLLYFLDRIFIYGRRETLLTLVLIILTLLYFKTNFLLKRALLVPCVIFGAVIISTVGQYRYVMENDLPLSEYSPLEGFTDSANTDHSNEVLIATKKINFIWDNDMYDMYLSLWDRVIHSYFPGQIFGAGLKKSLTFSYNQVTTDMLSGTYSSGMTSTGFVDSFQAFSFFGFMIFFLIGVLLKRVWNQALHGRELAIILYPLLLSKSLFTITHSSAHFFLELISFYVFFGFYYLCTASREVV